MVARPLSSSRLSYGEHLLLRCDGNSALNAESEEELKSLLVKVKEKSEKAVLKLNIQKT